LAVSIETFRDADLEFFDTGEEETSGSGLMSVDEPRANAVNATPIPFGIISDV
jgi:hypothetical protein